MPIPLILQADAADKEATPETVAFRLRFSLFKRGFSKVESCGMEPAALDIREGLSKFVRGVTVVVTLLFPEVLISENVVPSRRALR
jgi:hypothetical protein